MQTALDGITRLFEAIGVPPLLGALVLGFVAGLVVAAGRAATANASSGSAALGAGRPVVVPGEGLLLVNGRPISIEPQALAEVQLLIGQERSIDAIKRLRAATRLDLRDSKLVVEAMRDDMRDREAA